MNGKRDHAKLFLQLPESTIISKLKIKKEKIERSTFLPKLNDNRFLK